MDTVWTVLTFIAYGALVVLLIGLAAEGWEWWQKRRVTRPGDGSAVEQVLRAWQTPANQASTDGVPPAGEAGRAEVDILLRWIYRHAGSRNLIAWPAGRWVASTTTT